MSGDVIKITALVIVVAVIVIVLRTRLQEYAFLLIVAVLCIVLLLVLDDVFSGVERLRDVFEKSGNNSDYFSVCLKALGISYIASFAANVCRDFGLVSLAQIVEMSGKAAIFMLSIPLVLVVLEMALKFVGL